MFESELEIENSGVSSQPVRRPVACTPIRVRLLTTKFLTGRSRVMWMLRLCCVILIAVNAGVLLAQHEANMPSEVQEGERRYMAACSVCHGPDGDAVEGADLARGKFRRASSGEELISLILNGIPGTAMPPNKMSVGRAGMIVAYLRYLATQPALGGDADRGRAIFEGKGGCLSCHRVLGNGSRLGPDLSDVGILRRAAEIEIALLEPDAEISAQNRFVRAVTQDGVTMTGRLLNHDMFTVQLFVAGQGLVSLDKSKLREFSFVGRSLMPSVRGELTDSELVDLVRYLASLRGADTP